MTEEANKELVAGLKPGDEVTWTDPDGGLCSGIYKVTECQPEENVYHLRNEAGSETEAYGHELS